MAALEESIARETVLALSNQYQSVADALMELVDNPFDYRHGRHLTVDIEIDKPRGIVTVLDYGGEGMDDSSLRDWISWGAGHAHAESDIGQWHVGGKLAAIYLADSLEIVSRRAGSERVWRFQDPRWGSRTTLYSGEPQEVSPDDLARIDIELASLPPRAGFTKVYLRGLKPHRYEAAILTGRLGNVYRCLLTSGDCAIRVNESEVTQVDIPESHVPTVVSANLPCGARLHGSIWVTDRERFRPGRGVGLKAGMRTVYNGRLITQGEEFGHYLAGRGQLQRLVGEVSVQGIRPNTTKSGWDTDSPEWQEVESYMYAAMRPLVTFLNQLSEAHPLSREQRKRAEQVRRDITAVLRRLEQRLGDGPDGGDDQPGGRLPPNRNGHQREAPKGITRGPTMSRTAPPENAVGRLLRRYAPTGVPPIRFDDLGRNPRTQPWADASGSAIVINTAYPLYEELGETESYLADCVVWHMVSEVEGDHEERALRVDEMLWLYREIQGG